MVNVIVSVETMESIGDGDVLVDLVTMTCVLSALISAAWTYIHLCFCLRVRSPCIPWVLTPLFVPCLAEMCLGTGRVQLRAITGG